MSKRISWHVEQFKGLRWHSKWHAIAHFLGIHFWWNCDGWLGRGDDYCWLCLKGRGEV